MKKRYAIILLLLVVLCVALLVACECKHKYSEWSVTTPATCDTAGERTRTCSKCGDTERETIPAGHTLRDVPEVPKTCEADGVLTVVIEGETLYSYTENYDASSKLEFLFSEGGRAYMQETRWILRRVRRSA